MKIKTVNLVAMKIYYMPLYARFHPTSCERLDEVSHYLCNKYC